MFSPTRRFPRPLLLLALVGTTGVAGCAAEWDGSVVFPADYASTYEKVHDCKPSAHPAAKYVITWLSPNGKDAMTAHSALPEGSTETAAWPEGTVLIKAQYDDSKCAELKNFTAMQKLAEGAAPDAGDWKWQHVDADGTCLNCDNGTACSGCHSQPACNGLVCTKRP